MRPRSESNSSDGGLKGSFLFFSEYSREKVDVLLTVPVYPFFKNINFHMTNGGEHSEPIRVENFLIVPP
jgi:hypothetical protein